MGKFQRIGWGPVRNEEHDLGTDLLVLARDARGFDRGLIVGAQVKAGPTWFSKPERDSDGEVTGWWYYERDTRHFDDWVTHGLPHLLVLHDLDADSSHWVHVTAERVTDTGKGCKILVPAAQTIDLEHLEDLMMVAAQQKAAPSVERKAFGASSEVIAPARRLRHALIAPRLVAPHPNLGFHKSITPEEAVALIASGRFADLREFAERREDVPDPAETGTPTADWGWALVRALWRWAMTDDVEPLRATVSTALDPPTRAASTVVLACALLRVEHHEDALSLLDELIAEDVLQPVDHAWLLVQRSRVRAELGDVPGARADASEVQRQLVGDADDVTVSPLAAAAAWQLYTTADLGEADVAGVVNASDTAVSWWRTQTMAGALHEYSTRAFRRWAQDRAHRWSREDAESVNLFAAELNADLTGEHGRWRAFSSLAARHRLMTAGPKDSTILGDGLDALRRSGDVQSLRLAVSHLWRLGPADAVADAVNRVPSPMLWTHTTAKANLDFWADAGDLVVPEAATAAALLCIGLVKGESADLLQRVRPTFIVELTAAEATASLLIASDERAHRAAAELLVSFGEKVPDVLGYPLSQVAQALTFDKLQPEDLEALREFGVANHGEVGSAVLGALAAHGEERARTEVVSRAAAGDLAALAAMGDITALNEAAVGSLIERFEQMVANTVSDASRGTYGMGLFDPALGLTLFNVSFPSIARWESVLALLADPKVAAEHKRGTCDALAKMADRLPRDISTQLGSLVDQISTTAARGLHEGEDLSGLAISVAVATHVLEGHKANRAAARLAGGTVRQKRDLADLLGRGWCEPMRPLLASLIADQAVEVRAAAARAVGRLAVSHPADELLSSLAEGLSEDEGVLVPRALLSGLRVGGSKLPDQLQAVVGRLERHPAASVRLAAHGIGRDGIERS